MVLLALTLLLSGGSAAPVDGALGVLHGPMMLDLHTALAEHTAAWLEVAVNDSLAQLAVPVEREADIGPLGKGGFHLATLTLTEGDVVTVTLASLSGPLITCTLDIDADVLRLALVTRTCFSSRPAVLSFIIYHPEE